MKYRLRIVLAEKNINLSKLSQLTGLSFETLRKVRDSEKGVKMETLEIIAKYLSIKVKDLLEEEE